MGEIRFVGTGETRGYPHLVCKKEKSVSSDNCLAYLMIPDTDPCNRLFYQGCHGQGKTSGFFFQVREKLGNLADCQGKLEFYLEIQGKTGNMRIVVFRKYTYSVQGEKCSF